MFYKDFSDIKILIIENEVFIIYDVLFKIRIFFILMVKVYEMEFMLLKVCWMF